MLRLIIVILSATLFYASHSQATTVWGQGYVSKNRPVELLLNLDERQQLLIYGLGPTLREYGVRNSVVSDPKLHLLQITKDGDRRKLTTNNDWQTSSSAEAVENALQDLGVELSSREAAIVKILNPGRYVVKVVHANPDRGGFAAAGVTTWDGDFDPDDNGGGTIPDNDEVVPGLWVGSLENQYELCFNVSRDGSTLNQRGSDCKSFTGDEEALNIAFIRLEGQCDEFLDNFDVDIDIPIVNNRFNFEVDLENIPLLPRVSVEIEGTFIDGAVEGTVSQFIGSGRCIGEFTAFPQ